MTRTLHRRTLLTLSAASAAVAATACRTGSGGGSASDDTAAVEPPAHVPFDGVTPDLPGDESGVINGYFSFPDPPVVRDGFPLPQTDTFTALLQGDPPSIPPSSNPVYAHFREQAGNDLQDTSIISTEYRDKFQVTVAGGELPDFVQITGVAQLPQLLEKEFTDLTEVLAGDNITQYPALASFTDANWDVARVNGRIWGIPQPRPPAGRVMLARGDLLAEHGLESNLELRDGKDFVDLLDTLTDRKDNVFAMGGDPTGWLLRAVREMMGAPNGWAREGDQFVNEISAEQSVLALEEAAKIVQAGYMHPNAFSDPGQNHNWFRAGVTPLLIQGFAMWSNYARSNPEFDTGVIALPRWDGGGAASSYLGQAGFGDFIGIKKQASDERLHEALRIVDYIASPFGTQQYLDIAYGLEGQTFSFEDGEPTFLPDKASEALIGWPYVGAGSQNVLYVPGRQDLVERQHAYLSEAIPNGTVNASTGLYSETAQGRGATWGARRSDLERSILLGEKPVTEWEGFAESWRKDVGDAIAAELQEAAASQG
ncbi:MAG TPA: extracellular solute-binding protein [Candidatus Avipropionibacterium avicola]|uniref:Extracellular solute-binding protein n=1 Tax=Candidatus Avipropionibacterium avicola TaxID=2840701 RepID=A0A9D1GWW8_9ACTN|nr:extracellular solute-binding protein [Candidatus Avipropionibacterium avicola]